MSPIAFLVLAALLIACALGVILARSPVRSALSLVLALFFVAIFFLLLDAHMLAALQVVVYAGAIMVLFLFVIMLLNLQEDPRALAHAGVRVAAGLLGLLFVIAVVGSLARANLDPGAAGMLDAVGRDFGSTEELARVLFTRFLLAFEVTSVLLLVAIVGAVVLAKKKLT